MSMFVHAVRQQQIWPWRSVEIKKRREYADQKRSHHDHSTAVASTANITRYNIVVVIKFFRYFLFFGKLSFDIRILYTTNIYTLYIPIIKSFFRLRRCPFQFSAMMKTLGCQPNPSSPPFPAPAATPASFVFCFTTHFPSPRPSPSPIYFWL